MLKKILFVTMLSGLSMLSGCASMVVTSDKMEQRTSFALGVDKSKFTISDRQDERFQTRYSVKLKSGKQYNCSITGVFGLFGPTVGDALCNKKGTVAKNPLLQNSYM